MPKMKKQKSGSHLWGNQAHRFGLTKKGKAARARDKKAK